MRRSVFLVLFFLSLTSLADALDDAILKHVQKEKNEQSHSGVLGKPRAPGKTRGRAATSEDRNKLSAQEKAEMAIDGLAESVASSHLTQHSITHSSSTVSQIPNPTKH